MNAELVPGVGSTLHGAHWTGVYFGRVDAIREVGSKIEYWVADRWFPKEDTIDSRFEAVSRQHALAEQELQYRESLVHA